jgi:Domain of unknown function (DUF4136)
MIMSRLRIVSLVAPLALLALGGCAVPFKAQVNRFQAMPAPQGLSFAVVASDPKRDGSLEFSQYAGLVGSKLSALGYQPAANADAANLIVKLDYGVDEGKEKLRSAPGSGFGYGFGGFGPWDRFGRLGYGHGYGSRYGYGRSGFIYGFHDPFLFGYGQDQVESYTVFTSGLDLTIERKANGERLFEGKAKAMSSDDNLTRLVPNLVEAMFTGFPGNSGETVKITVAPPEKK